MIPYIVVKPIIIIPGLITVEPFGLLVTIGGIVGVLVAGWDAKTHGLELLHLVKAAICALVLGSILSHVVAITLYYPNCSLGNFWTWVDIESGLSSYGGFLGGSLGAMAYLKRQKLPILEYGDALVLGLT